MKSSLNNLLVESLREGKAETVDALALLGVVGLSTPLDLVLHAPRDLLSADREPEVSTHSLWFWVHQAPSAAAAVRCWETWVARDLSRLDTPSAQARLQELFVEAVTAAMSSGNSAALAETWHRAEDAASQWGLGWSSQAASHILASTLGAYGDDATPVLSDLYMRGLVVSRMARAWADDPQGPWDQAICRGFSGLLDGLAFVAESIPAPVVRRLDTALSIEMSRLLSEGAGAWTQAGLGDRLLQCRDVLVRLGHPENSLHPDLSRAVDLGVADPSAWPERLAAQFSAWRMEAALPKDAPADPPRRARM